MWISKFPRSISENFIVYSLRRRPMCWDNVYYGSGLIVLSFTTYKEPQNWHLQIIRGALSAVSLTVIVISNMFLVWNWSVPWHSSSAPVNATATLSIISPEIEHKQLKFIHSNLISCSLIGSLINTQSVFKMSTPLHVLPPHCVRCFWWMITHDHHIGWPILSTGWSWLVAV